MFYRELCFSTIIIIIIAAIIIIIIIYNVWRICDIYGVLIGCFN